MSSPAKRSQYGYQLGYIFGATEAEGLSGKAFLLGWRPGITGGFVGSHGLREVRRISSAVLHRKALAMASAACLLVSGDTWP